ncbi:helix-turn-helix domain-containing protein [Polynucleobacter sp. MWH-UH23A]|uniref:helix-turn-helix domain-containing protein n=1 Tax=Polynucleobacter sp. MWH-UH23A TaxID=1855613 RepID=UPI003364FA40
MNRKNSSVYLAIYNDIRLANKRFGLSKQLEISMLNAVYEAYLDQIQLRVLDLLLLEGLASQATLHATLKSLQAKKLVEMKFDPTDGRIKLVLPTKLALKRLKECEIIIRNHCK